jgi:hypothetical protein
VNFLDWEEAEEQFDFSFPKPSTEKMGFLEFLFRETRTNIKALPEISYEEIPDFLI